MQDNGNNIRKADNAEEDLNSKSEKSEFKSIRESQTTANSNRKNVLRILEFYDDNTFLEYLPTK
jgi:hypothetical protein